MAEASIALGPGEEAVDPDAALPEEDVAFLREKHPEFRLTRVNGWLHVVLPDVPLSEAYVPQSASMLIRLPGGYSDSAPDMFWTLPSVRLRSGAIPDRADVPETYAGVTWQRWSRHFDQSKWRPGLDSLRTYYAAIQRELARGR